MGGKTPSNASGRLRTLVVGVNWLGDTVMTLPALAALRRDFEHEVFHVTVHQALSPLIPLALDVDAVLPWTSEDSLGDRIRMVKRGGYDRAVIFPNSFRSAWIVWRSRIPERWGYAGQLRGWMLNRPVAKSRRPRGVHQSEHYLEIVRRMGWTGDVPRIRLSIPKDADLWAANRIDFRKREARNGKTGPIVGLCPGAAYGPAKRWAPERFVQTAKVLKDEIGARFVLIGSKNETDAANQVSTAIGDAAVDLSGKTDIVQLAAVLSRCDLVIANDSGPMHLASAVGTPVVGLFGSTDPVATGPLGPHRIVSSNVDCAPCLKRRCEKGDYRCLQEIQPEQVVRAAVELLQE